MGGLTRKALLLALTQSACATNAEPNPAWLDDFVELFYRRKDVRTAFERYVAPDYIQHSSGMAQGRDAAIAVLEPMFARDTFTATPMRTIVSGDLALVLLHVTVGADIQALVIDIFRVADQRAVEHWDLKQEVPTALANDYFVRL